MNDIELIRLYLYTNLSITALSVIGLIIWAIKKRMLKFAFRRHEVWQLQESFDSLDRSVYQLKELNKCLDEFLIDNEGLTLKEYKQKYYSHIL